MPTLPRPSAAQVLELRLDLRAEIRLRIRGSLVFAMLTLGDGLLCRLEGSAQRLGPRQRISIEGLAEIGEIAVVGAAEGGSVLGRSGDDDGLWIAQGVDEAAGITRGNQDDAPLNSRLAQRLLEILGREAGERKPGIGHRYAGFLRTMRGDGEKKHILAGIHALGKTLQCVVQCRHARQRRTPKITLVVDQRKMPVTDVEPLPEHAGREAD